MAKKSQANQSSPGQKAVEVQEKQPLILSCSPIFNSEQCGEEFALHGMHLDAFGVDSKVNVTITFIDKEGHPESVTTTGTVMSPALIVVKFPKLKRKRAPGSGGISTTVGNTRGSIMARHDHAAAW